MFRDIRQNENATGQCTRTCRLYVCGSRVCDSCDLSFHVRINMQAATNQLDRDTLQQMLQVPLSKKVKYCREKKLQVLHVLAVLKLCVLRDTCSTRSIPILSTANAAILAVFWGSKLWDTAVLEVFWGSTLWNTVCS